MAVALIGNLAANLLLVGMWRRLVLLAGVAVGFPSESRAPRCWP